MIYKSETPTPSTISTLSTSHTVPDGREIENSETSHEHQQDGNSTQRSIAVTSSDHVIIQYMDNQDQLISIHDLNNLQISI